MYTKLLYRYIIINNVVINAEGTVLIFFGNVECTGFLLLELIIEFLWYYICIYKFLAKVVTQISYVPLVRMKSTFFLGCFTLFLNFSLDILSPNLDWQYKIRMTHAFFVYRPSSWIMTDFAVRQQFCLVWILRFTLSQ